MRLEKRTFVNQEKLIELISFFDQNCSKKEVEKQIIYFYHTEREFRIIRTNKYIKMNLKAENINEIDDDIFIAPKYDITLINMFNKLGIKIDLKRYRIRHKYIYNNLYITLDENIKFGNVLRIRIQDDKTTSELEKIIFDLYEKLNIESSNMELFNELYSKYKIEWVNLTKNINDEEFINN
ncbi:MAG: hypothetical protein PHN42_04165 [Bacilli bacterium]|nr:hypothetical protein [Bacilli bacterium]